MTAIILPLKASGIISISQARVLGLKRYFTGIPCKHGHVAERITADRHCVECIAIKNKTQREGTFKGHSKRWFKNHPGYISNWVNSHKPSVSLYNKRSGLKRRSCGGKLSIGLREKLMELQSGLCACCKQSIEDKCHMDHIYPLSRGGKNEDQNIQLLCPNCNRLKGFKNPIDFMQSNGYLL